ncbi:PREDICTED: uncharacterized protein LOC104588505 isoform X2 [Nelumbo nucifera]|uniref:Uncharacterized protein LOC104588505 isoform X2 n=2 Tax=Nelumbo nucifera TaxID=4432 RepID=A0A1U7YYU3_NELNU|nr:PREDICTED: uncharacterized protein LOC104588505 isoform X2 [Nelumbo nucifera]DAD45112.1 TPA_asm: hypothetical protein HUJ06_003342 [Nelumbo nucifera]
MDNSWQSKCSSSWQQSAAPALPSPSQLLPQGSRNQMEINAGHPFQSYSVQELNFTNREVMQEPLVFSTLNLGSSTSSKPELANSFLALLSGSSSQLQSEFQQLSNSKSTMIASKLPIHDISVMVNRAGCGGPITPSVQFSQPQGNENMRNDADVCPIAPSKIISTASCGRVSVLHDNLQMASLNCQNVGSPKTSIHHTVQGNERGVNPRWGWFSSTNPSAQLHTKNIQASINIPSETKAAGLDHSSTTRRHPRVFCLGTSGDLLLSNTGLIGVVCLCHNLHMSISKFCEHSGLCAVNPGDAVRLESGETISQWRRLYFHKFGIRVPDDHSGWDWPEEFLATSGLVKYQTTVPDMHKNSEMFQPVDSLGELARPGKYWNNILSSRNQHTQQSAVQKPANNIMHYAQQRNSQEENNLLVKNSIGTSHNVLPAMVDKQIIEENPISRGLTMPTSAHNKRRQDNGYQSISDYIDFITKGGNLFVSNPSLGCLKSPGTNSDTNRCNSSREAFIMDRDGMPSNIELRLGQPSQQSCTMCTSVLPAAGPQPLDTLVFNPRVTEESRQNVRCNPSDATMSYGRETECQVNPMHHALGSSNTIYPAKVEQFKTDATKNSLISMFLSHLNAASGGDIQPQAACNIVSSNEQFMPGVPCNESHISKCDPAALQWNRSEGTERQSGKQGPGLHNQMDKGKGVRVSDNCYFVPPRISSVFHSKQVPNSGPSTGVIGGYCLPGSSTVYERQSSVVGQPSAMLLDANRQSNQFGKVSCTGSSGHLDHAFLRSIHSSLATAGSDMPVSVISVGSSSATSMSRPNLMPAFSNKEGMNVNPHLLDENLRLLVLKHIAELSKRENAIASHDMNPEQVRLHSFSSTELQRKGIMEDPFAAEESREGPYPKSKQDTSKVSKPLQSCSNCYTSGGVGKLADVGDLNNWCNSSAISAQGVATHCKEPDIQFLSSHDALTYEQPLLRLGRMGNTATASVEHGKHCHKEPNSSFPGKCSCAVHSVCLAGNCILRCEGSHDTYKEHVGTVGGKSSMLVPSLFDNGHAIPEEKANAVGQNENLKSQLELPMNDYHATQWRDVPGKVMGVCNSAHVKKVTEDVVLDDRGNVEDQFADTAAIGLKRSLQEAESLKEQQMSNVCSGCSAPAVTEVSVEVNNMDSYTVVAGDARYMNDLVVDEGSGIEKCWSSDDSLDSESGETLRVTGKIEKIKGLSSALPNQSLRGLNEVKVKSLYNSKKVRNRLHAGFTFNDNINHAQQLQRELKHGKKKKAMKWKRLDATCPDSGLSSVHYDYPKLTGYTELNLCSSKEMQMPYRSDHGMPKTRIYSNGPSSLKRKRSALSSAKTLSQKRDLYGLDGHQREWENDHQTQANDDLSFLREPRLSGGKNLKQDWTMDMNKKLKKLDMNCVITEKASKYNSLTCIKNTANSQVDTCDKTARPVVCGNSGIISNGKLAEGIAKPPKILSLSTILKKTRKCSITEDEPSLATMLDIKKTNSKRRKVCHDDQSMLKKEGENKASKTAVQNGLEPGTSIKEAKDGCYGRTEVHASEISILRKEHNDGSNKKHGALHNLSSVRLKPKFKEMRKRSLYELTTKGKIPSSVKLSLTNISKCKLESKCISSGLSSLKDAEDSQDQTDEMYQEYSKSIKERTYQAFILDSDAFCCVCGSSNKDETNCLLECSHCLIKVHQACYGVSKVPKGRWCCRPCKTNSKNIVCVLCGYEGGAMTRALRSCNIVKSLLKAWNIIRDSKTKGSMPLSRMLPDESNASGASDSGRETDSIPVTRPVENKQLPAAVLKRDLKNHANVGVSSGSPNNFQVQNTITAGVYDLSVTQWVHMVCGLWTPGTRCPNVDTMSAFDVSGASRPGKNVVCSMCKRPGGSCINCRVVNCSVQFHPWCAHQKGLLQSEVEGADNEKVGFYGRCMIHAAQHLCDSDIHLADTKTDSAEKNEATCARTEGYKGRKRDGFRHNLPGQSNKNGGCLVPQEQINAWLHINGQKSCTRGFLKPLPSDVEYDCRKEYARYKQAKGWKHLVVYKSGIHALGLYTSRFIARGAMVVEYVGEIVGLRVADKREVEYQSGRRLQYKSACYFFRIDKEHIIDATRKGGIARFVNHSCLPNCVAKVISVRNEKKVVFFAERDINPGEEITYDYHFNHEDEGKKIPCFCNSKNCRRYLN